MNLQQLTTFCTVLSEGSMTAAADKLFLTQPAVSQQIRSLEEDMAAQLLVRGVRQIKPTLQGQLLFDYAKKILHLTQQAEVAIQTISQDISGSLRIGTVNSMGMYLISPIIGLFLKHNSKLNIKLVYGSYEQVIDGMKTNQIDVSILPDSESEFNVNLEEFESQFLFKDEMWLAASGRDSSVPGNIDVKEFNSRPIVIYSEMYPQFKRLFEKQMIANNIEFYPVFESDNVGTLKRVVESGLGWGFLPAHSIKKQIRTNRLVRVLADDLKYSVNINLYTRKTASLKQMSEVLYRALKQQALNQ